MYVAWRLHSLVCNFFWFSLVCWGFVQGYLHRGCLCKRETRTEAELVERVEVAGALSIPVLGNILSGMFLVAGAVQPSVRSQERTPPWVLAPGLSMQTRNTDVFGVLNIIIQKTHDARPMICFAAVVL